MIVMPDFRLWNRFDSWPPLRIARAALFRSMLYDKRKLARSVHRNATVKIETVRPNDTRKTLAFLVKSGFLESTDDIPEPHEFKAIVQVSRGSHKHTHEIQFSRYGRSEILYRVPLSAIISLFFRFRR